MPRVTGDRSHDSDLRDSVVSARRARCPWRNNTPVLVVSCWRVAWRLHTHVVMDRRGAANARARYIRKLEPQTGSTPPQAEGGNPQVLLGFELDLEM